MRTRHGAISTCSSSGGGTWFPALVETVKGYAHHESSTLERVVEARGQAVQPASIAERGTREQGLSAAVGRLFAVAEAYPDLKASQNFQDLQRNLVEIENNDPVRSAVLQRRGA